MLKKTHIQRKPERKRNSKFNIFLRQIYFAAVALSVLSCCVTSHYTSEYLAFIIQLRLLYLFKIFLDFSIWLFAHDFSDTFALWFVLDPFLSSPPPPFLSIPFSFFSCYYLPSMECSYCLLALLSVQFSFECANVREIFKHCTAYTIHTTSIQSYTEVVMNESLEFNAQNNVSIVSVFSKKKIVWNISMMKRKRGVGKREKIKTCHI